MSGEAPSAPSTSPPPPPQPAESSVSNIARKTTTAEETIIKKSDQPMQSASSDTNHVNADETDSVKIKTEPDNNAKSDTALHSLSLSPAQTVPSTSGVNNNNMTINSSNSIPSGATLHENLTSPQSPSQSTSSLRHPLDNNILSSQAESPVSESPVQQARQTNAPPTVPSSTTMEPASRNTGNSTAAIVPTLPPSSSIGNNSESANNTTPVIKERSRSPMSVDVPYQQSSSPVVQQQSDSGAVSVTAAGAARAGAGAGTAAAAETVQEQELVSDVRSSPPPSPQRTSPPPPPPQQQQQQANGYRPLNVKDALTYLDQVKIQFSDQPEIYNKFLDIMKDFKSQAIDTPGVIERVSTLFRGHPTLISGFNTFLPPGYRIECTVDEHGRNIIKVTTPSGTTTTTDDEPLNLNSATNEARYYQPYTQQQQQQAVLTSGFVAREPGGLCMTPHAPPPPSTQQQQTVSHPYSHHNHNQASPPSSHEDPNSSRKAPVEFNHAINYVNKIKNRFSVEPETYKQFLEILQTYQKEQKPIQEVYAQVQTLFNGANDLLDEFKQFLPEASGAVPGDINVFFGGAQGKRGSMMVPSLSTTGTRKKRMSAAGITKMSNVRSGMETDDDLQPSRATVSAEEAEFFDRVKKYIGNKATYRAFLKLLNLFSQQILDQNLLVARVESFIGGNRELFDWFKTLVGYDTKEGFLTNEPQSKEKLYLTHCASCGPSYRRVPKEWQEQICSGRDTLCSEVLNDEYVSHPRWASEDSEFVASKKNHFEEALHRVEEERYDYDLSIEANLNTIALLEPVSKKISVMSLEEKATFRLPPGLGGPSKAIYQHIIKKIYGPERGVEIIELVHDNPIATVPILLKRLKQKDDEWKRAQREWNKIWREVESQNYYKALDYQGVTFKSSDKKAMGTNALLSEIENIRSLQPEKRLFLKGRPMVVPDGGSRLPPQFSFSFKDQPTFKDVTRLILSFLEHQDIYSQEECDGLRSVLETFVPAMFDVLDISPSTDLPKGRGQEDGDEDDVMAEADDEGGDDDRAAPSSYDSDGDVGMSEAGPGHRSTTTRPVNNDNNTDKQDSQSGTAAGQFSNDTQQRPEEPSGSVGGGPSPPPEEPVDNDPLDEGKPKPPVITFFGNDTFYCFVRLFQLVYTRLQKMKLADIAYRKNSETTKKANKAALDLEADNVTIHDVEMDFSHGYYYALLDLIDLFFDGAVNQATFEECSRYIFGSKAYIMFTIDKLILLLTRHMHHIMADVRSRQLVELFRTYRNLEHPPDAQQLATYKVRAEQDVIGIDQNVYGIVFDTGTRILSIQLLDQEDYPLETDARIAYNDYITEFADFNVPTRGIQEQELKRQFLKRNITGKRKREDNEDAYVYPGMQYKISKESYHMFYIINTEDTYIRKRRAVYQQQESTTSSAKKDSKWHSWLESDKGWSRNIESKEMAEKEAKALFSGTKEDDDSATKEKDHKQAKNDPEKSEQVLSATHITSTQPPPPSSTSTETASNIEVPQQQQESESKQMEKDPTTDNNKPKTPPPPPSSSSLSSQMDISNNNSQ